VTPLDSCYAKLRHAEVHAQALHEEIRAFHGAHALRINGRPDVNGSSDFVFTVEARKDPPTLEWGCRIGDIFHNLHSALDALAWQLAIFALRREPMEREARSISCPIAISEADFDSLPIVRLLDSTHVATLRSLQPYQRGGRSRAESHPLAALKRFSNVDKHRVVTVNFVALEDFPLKSPTATDYEMTRITTAPVSTPLVDGQELARVEGVVTGPQPEVEGHAKLTGRVAFSDGTPAQQKIDEIGRSAKAFINRFEGTL
jgi:hypothetical protein